MSELLDYFLEINKIPNILLYGNSGSGKKTIINNFLKKIYKNNEDTKKYILKINCGDGMGIKLIREELKFFGKIVIEKNKLKMIILYNGDKLTCDAQCALRRCIEIYSKNTRFIVILQDKNKLLKPLISRFCEIFIPNTKNYYKIINNNYKDEISDLNNILQIENTSELVNTLYNNGFHIFDLINYYKVQDTENKNYYLVFVDIFRKNVFNEKIIMYFILFLFKMRPSIELFNINSY